MKFILLAGYKDHWVMGTVGSFQQCIQLQRAVEEHDKVSGIKNPGNRRFWIKKHRPKPTLEVVNAV